MEKSNWQGFLEYSLVLDVILVVMKLGYFISISWGALLAIALAPPLLYLLYRIINYFYFK